jgi:hypothetical protein
MAIKISTRVKAEEELRECRGSTVEGGVREALLVALDLSPSALLFDISRLIVAR